MSEIDLMLAIQLQARFEEELRASREKEQQLKSKVAAPAQGSTTNKWKAGGILDESPQEKLSVSLIDPSWEMIDPNPDIHMLFLTFNDQFFWGRLLGVEVKWSPRMTLCAGVCSYEGRGGLCSVRLSMPLLKLRPRKDLIETLLHEMIHAYLFVTANNRDREGHGPEFHKHMYRINGVAGTKISVFHSFHDEVDVYRQHIWQCNGPCKTRRPYFGLVKRAMNREPGPRDPWWERHRQSCGGVYTKIQEPEGYSDKNKKSLAADSKKKPDNCGDIRKFIEFKGKGNTLNSDAPESSCISKPAPSSKKEMGVKSVNERNTVLKENMPVFGVKNKSSDKGSEDSFSSGGAKPKNIHGLGSTSSGPVKQVSVDNASKSKVYGFGGTSPAKKKPRNVPKQSNMGNASAKAVGKPNGGFGSALAVRGGGSRTITVKGKLPVKTETQVNDGHKMESATSVPTVFQGQGFSLGGPSTGISRLLSLTSSSDHSTFTSASISPTETEILSDTEETSSLEKAQNHRQNPWISRSPAKRNRFVQGDKTPSSFNKPLGSSSASNQSDYSSDDLNKCPVCNKSFSKWKINQHLDECIGKVDDEDSWSAKNKNNSSLKRPLSQNVKKENVFTSEDDELEQFAQSSACSASKTERGERETEGSTSETCPEELFPCPVCNEFFSELNINPHLDKHF
ncbi:DNA-dependent metalloprotease SPRTN isoform X1 [Procambarus clarkii]|uniref:DNA-dependent metalloprotease SPRTN isoform X1 n=2 Tax=Procambarus clarkii TaxID=6728 RepID=UPI0037435434